MSRIASCIATSIEDADPGGFARLRKELFGRAPGWERLRCRESRHHGGSQLGRLLFWCMFVANSWATPIVPGGLFIHKCVCVYYIYIAHQGWYAKVRLENPKASLASKLPEMLWLKVAGWLWIDATAPDSKDEPLGDGEGPRGRPLTSLVV